MAQENGTADEAHTQGESSLQLNGKSLGSTQNGGAVTKKQNDKGTTGTVPFFKLFSFADSIDMMLMAIGTLAAVGNGIAMPLMTILLGDVIDSFGQNQFSSRTVDEVSKVSLKYVYLAIGSGTAALLQMSSWMVTGERQAARIRTLYLQNILRQDIAFFDVETSTGEVIGRMSGDTVLIQDAMGEKVGKSLQLLATFLGGFTIAFIRGWMLSAIMLSVIPLLAMAGATMARLTSKAASRGQNAYTEAASLAEQIIGSIRTVASFTGEKRAVQIYDKLLVKAYKAGVREGMFLGLGLGILTLVMFSSYSLAVYVGGKMILHKGYSGGQVINVVLAVLTSSMSLGQITPSLSAFAAGRAAAYKMFQTINRKSEIDAYNTNGKVQDDIHGDIELRNVRFSYPSRPNEEVFSGFSLTIPSGTTSALVGHSGSGKSTVISLIERFYDPQAGEVLIDGINLKEFQLKWIRGKIGLVSQEPVLFSSSISENIAYGKPEATKEEIKAAAELANAAKFVDKLPQGYDTIVGEHGTQLSGGQKQRVAIARAILKDPRILLLDEATSALDAESERIVQEALDRIMVNRTTVIVAHRLTTVKNADMIAVIHRGKVVEKGTHNELLEDPDGAYTQLVRFQQMNKEEDNLEQLKSDVTTTESFRHSSVRISIQRSLSRGSSRHSSHSFAHSIGLPTGIGTIEPYEQDELPSSDDNPPVPLRRLAYLNKPEVPVLLLGSVAACISASVLPIYGILISRAIKAFYEPVHQLRRDTHFWSLMFLTLGIISFVANPIKTSLFSVAGCKLVQRIRSKCFEKVVNMEVGWFDEASHSSGFIGARLSTDAAIVRSLVGDSLATTVQNAATATCALVIAFSGSWQLAFIILLIFPLMVVSSVMQVKFMKGFSADAKAMYEEASQVANDAVGSIRTVASFCAEERVMEVYRKKCEGPTKAGVRLGLISGFGLGISSFFLFCFYAISFYAGARLVEAGHTSFSSVFQVFFALTMASIGMSHASSVTADSTKAKAAAASIFAIIDRKSAIDPSDESGITLGNIRGDIELSNVRFRYPSRPDVQIFKDLSLSIQSGQTVALVGESGCGKSTVVSLLQRFYDPDSGSITIDGTDLQKFNLRWLRKQMGLVGQEPVLFNDTIRSNISYGKDGNATEAEVKAAADLANAHKFISALHQGYDTIVGERGIQLSGGQKQRVAIARAIVKDPKILLLDEATSALDSESERIVQEALERVMVNRTTVVIAHRLSTIRNADVIAVVRNGKIVEKGRHDSLINIKNGFYASLVQLHVTTKTA